MKRRDFLLGTIWGGLWGSIVTRFMGKKEEPNDKTIRCDGLVSTADYQFLSDDYIYNSDAEIHWEGFRESLYIPHKFELGSFDSREVTCSKCQQILFNIVSIFEYDQKQMKLSLNIKSAKSWNIQDILDKVKERNMLITKREIEYYRELRKVQS